MPGEIDHGEQQLANFGGHFAGVGRIELGFDLVGCLANLGPPEHVRVEVGAEVQV